MNKLNKKWIALAVGVALLAFGAAGGWWWSKRSTMAPAMATGAAMADPGADPGANKAAEKKALFWYDPMFPQQRFDKPGKSPFMDMMLVPKYADESGEAGVKIDASVLQNLGARLVPVTRVTLATQIEATGMVGFNERDVAVLQNRATGFVERMWPLAPGDMVKAGQPLVEFLVPEWVAAQHELLAIRNAGDASLLAAARDRLRLLGMSEKLISEVERSGTVRSRYTVTAPISGLVQSLEVRSGMTVMAGQTLARINGLGTVWLEAAVPEAQAGSVRVGGPAQVRLAGLPGEVIEGRVTAILPMLNEAARSLRVRVELPNRDGRLRPGLSALVTLGIASKDTALAVPTEAIIRTGKRALVMLAGDNGRFIPVTVTLGREVNDRTVILAGLEEGQQVVASGQFLIDSEASLSGVMARAVEEPNTAGRASLHQAEATIKDIANGEVTLAHGPFKTLSMPGMTMAFPLAKPELAKGLKAGDKVEVFVRQGDAGLMVERIEKMGEGK